MKEMGVEGWGISWGVVGGGGWVEGVGDSPPHMKGSGKEAEVAASLQWLRNHWQIFGHTFHCQRIDKLSRVWVSCVAIMSLSGKKSRQMSSRETQWVDKGGG